VVARIKLDRLDTPSVLFPPFVVPLSRARLRGESPLPQRPLSRLP
jgi:hypothetical protein